jgi:hypothetical protein
MNWNDGIADELSFWNDWYETKGCTWPDDYKFRINPDTEIQSRISEHLVNGNEKIMDVGAGPLTILGKNWKGKKLNIRACDALAVSYAKINERHAINPIIVTEECKAEELVVKYGYCSFNIIHAQNCIDHCIDPVKAIIQMVSLADIKGIILLRHEVNEGKNEGYKGLHQWDFYEKNGDFMISGKGMDCNITRLLKYDALVKTKVQSGYIENTILVR